MAGHDRSAARPSRTRSSKRSWREIILTPIYEAEFLGFSYGFRPGRGAHNALDALAVGIDKFKINWVVDCDIRKFFDTVSRDWLVRFLEHRIADKRVIRLIIKWLNAGVMEDGEWRDDLRGTPQGSVISPILANVYLHYVLDLWFHKKWRNHEVNGDAIIVRYADDFVAGFQHKQGRGAISGRAEGAARKLRTGTAS